jgi:hypothetical protein
MRARGWLLLTTLLVTTPARAGVQPGSHLRLPDPDYRRASTFAGGADVAVNILQAEVVTDGELATTRLAVELVIEDNGDPVEVCLRVPVPPGAVVTGAALIVNDAAPPPRTSPGPAAGGDLQVDWVDPGWIDVTVPAVNQAGRAFALTWVEPLSRDGADAVLRVPIVATSRGVIVRPNGVVVDGALRAVSGPWLELDRTASASASAALAWQRVGIEEVARPALVLVIESNAGVGTTDLRLRARTIEAALFNLPPDARVSVLLADWMAKPIGHAIRPADALARIARADLDPAGLLEPSWTLAAALDEAAVIDAHAIVWVGAGLGRVDDADDLGKRLGGQGVHLIVVGASDRGSLGALASRSGGLALVDTDTELLGRTVAMAVLSGASFAGLRSLPTLTGDPVWLGPAVAGAPLSPPAAALWARASLDAGQEVELEGAVLPGSPLIAREADAEHGRWAVPPVRSNPRLRVVVAIAVAATVAVTLDKNLIRRTVRRSDPGVTACWERSLREGPTLPVTLDARFRVRRGAVTDVVVTTVLGARRPALEACVAQVLGALDFPRVDQVVEVASYPFRLNMPRAAWRELGELLDHAPGAAEGAVTIARRLGLPPASPVDLAGTLLASAGAVDGEDDPDAEIVVLAARLLHADGRADEARLVVDGLAVAAPVRAAAVRAAFAAGQARIIVPPPPSYTD